MKKHIAKFNFILALSMVFLLSSCLKDNETSPIPVGGLLTVNAYNESNSVIFYANDVPLSNRGLKFKEVSANYYSFPIGSQQLAVRSFDEYSNVNQSYLATQNLVVKDSTLYTAFIFGNEKKPKLGIVEDHGIDNLAKDQSGVRFFNLTTDKASTVSLEIGEANENTDWKDRAPNQPSDLSDFQDFNSIGNGKYDLVVKDENGETLAVRNGISLDPLNYYTVVFLENNVSLTTSNRPNNNLNETDEIREPYYIGVIKH